MTKRFSDEQIISILCSVAVSARELCRKHAISDTTFYTCRNKFGGMKAPEVKRLRSLERRRASQDDAPVSTAFSFRKTTL